MNEIRGLVGGGLMHGGGTNEEVFLMGLAKEPHYIGCDGGSTDGGPAFLGSGKVMTTHSGLKQSLDVMLRGAISAGIPLIVGSAGMAGGRPHVQRLREIIEEVARERGLHFKMAVIDSEQDKEYLHGKLHEGKVRPLGPVPELTDGDLDRCVRVVGMMGPEPIIRALDEGAQVVLCGRSSDSAVFAAAPIRAGFQPALAWHMAKTIECGAMVSEPVEGVTTSIMGRVRDDHFLIEPSNPRGICNPLRVAGHTLYENPSPYILVEPGVAIDTSGCSYEAFDDRTVKVSGSRLIPSEKYTIKLEGAEMVGYRTITIAATRDPVLVGSIDSYIQRITERARGQALAQGIASDEYKLFFRVYGKGEVMGQWEPNKQITAPELCIIGETIAKSQDMANSVMNIAHGALLHTPFEGRLCSAGNMAFPYSPSDVEMGPVYRFNIWHVVEPANPYEMFPMEIVSV